MRFRSKIIVLAIVRPVRERLTLLYTPSISLNCTSRILNVILMRRIKWLFLRALFKVLICFPRSLGNFVLPKIWSATIVLKEGRLGLIRIFVWIKFRKVELSGLLKIDLSGKNRLLTLFSTYANYALLIKISGIASFFMWWNWSWVRGYINSQLLDSSDPSKILIFLKALHQEISEKLNRRQVDIVMSYEVLKIKIDIMRNRKESTFSVKLLIFLWLKCMNLREIWLRWRGTIELPIKLSPTIKILLLEEVRAKNSQSVRRFLSRQLSLIIMWR